MKSRILVALVGIPALLAILLVCPPICLPFTLAALCAVAAYELLWATGYVRHTVMVTVTTAVAILIPFWYYFGTAMPVALGGLLLFFVALCACAIASGQTVRLGQIGACLFAGLLVPLLLGTFVLMRDMEYAKFYLLLPFVSAFISDAFALFAGMAFGKHKLAPVLSPKKTIEGSAGGFVGSTIMCACYGLVLHTFFDLTPHYGVLILYGLLGSFVSQLGDLSFSYIKREFGLKDYGHLMPGHGGVLDRFDSVIFCAPMTYVMVSFLPFFTR